ncbi:MAG TPA: DNA recombination protein RmuC [Chthoniobacteraceae bacterium]|nr:DNA recombination protein RmuC [Chthoniobacteraceae bacterium]
MLIFHPAARRSAEALEAMRHQLAGIESAHERLEGTLRSELAQARLELAATVRDGNRSMLETLQTISTGQTQQWNAFSTRLEQVGQLTETRLETIRGVVETKLTALREENSQRLEAMRQTVDEKLHGTLEKRLGESFRHVSERLEQVHRGLGEMQTLATGVGDLKRVLTNVKTRGIWGEIQLGALLEQLLAPDQFERNVRTRPERNEVVEYAVRLPGGGEDGEPVWLPIDAKFPVEDYQRLLEGYECGDAAALERASKALRQRVLQSAKEITTKYLNPPLTTDFAILFLPTEGLFAEVCRLPGLVDTLQREERVVITGPTTFAALLNSLQIGFRTLSIQKESSRVWQILGEVKTEFGRFGDALDGVKKKLHEATNRMDDVGRRSRAVERRLRHVAEGPETAALLEE